MQKPEFNNKKFNVSDEIYLEFINPIRFELGRYTSGLVSVNNIIKIISGKYKNYSDLYIEFDDDHDVSLKVITATKEYKQYLIEMEKYKIWEAEQKIKELEQE